MTAGANHSLFGKEFYNFFSVFGSQHDQWSHAVKRGLSLDSQIRGSVNQSFREPSNHIGDDIQSELLQEPDPGESAVNSWDRRRTGLKAPCTRRRIEQLGIECKRVCLTKPACDGGNQRFCN